MKRTVYLDHAAATPLDPQVKKAMDPFLSTHFANASALYPEARLASQAINSARKTVANCVNAQPDTIIFTSGGTESNNLAVLGVAKGFGTPGHIISVATEHEAVLKPLQALAQDGWEITFVPVGATGLVNPTDIIKAIKPSTALITVMYANNEIGTIQPLAEIGRHLLRARKESGSVYPYFHTDACQAAGYLDLDVEKLHVDLMTLNGGKIYGPKGSGCLYVRRGTKLAPVQYGGAHEYGRRGGTENVPGIVGFATALELAQKLQNKENKKLEKLSKFFYKNVESKIKNLHLNGPEIGASRLPNNLNIHIPGIEGEAVVIYLGEKGVMCSTGSACTAVSSEPSHVLFAIGLSEKAITSSLRFSLGRTTTKTDILYAVKTLRDTLYLLRADQ